MIRAPRLGLPALTVVLCAALSAASPGSPLAVPFFKQQTNGCGAASVAMVMHYWAQDAPEPNVVYQSLYHQGQPGIRLADMKSYLEDAGFLAYTLRGKWDDIDAHVSRKRPIIVGLKKKNSDSMHFAVVTGLDRDRVWLNDPTRKKTHRIRKSEFDKQWDIAGRWMLVSTPRAE